mmetsp:Transcript_15002/g.18108  ORF Transcript_15002/g.18108 Transcript_15002/m.18108 type:complete len:157 (+) Transcript_15002:3-473(+)
MQVGGVGPTQGGMQGEARASSLTSSSGRRLGSMSVNTSQPDMHKLALMQMAQTGQQGWEARELCMERERNNVLFQERNEFAKRSSDLEASLRELMANTSKQIQQLQEQLEAALQRSPERSRSRGRSRAASPLHASDPVTSPLSPARSERGDDWDAF